MRNMEHRSIGGKCFDLGSFGLRSFALRSFVLRSFWERYSEYRSLNTYLSSTDEYISFEYRCLSSSYLQVRCAQDGGGTVRL